MKRIIYLILCIALGVITLESFKKRPNGTDPGHTGSPGDSLKNCTVCHGGVATPIEGWITSDIPETGYVPGETYTITATNTEDGGTRFGFQVSPQNIAGDLLGTIIVSDSVKTQLVGAGKYITYTSNGIDGLGSNSWVFKWKAPNAGTGQVVFYGAFNSNFEGHKDGDKTFLSTLTVNESGTTGVNTLKNQAGSFSLYPNPATDNLFVSINTQKQGLVSLLLKDISGKEVLQSQGSLSQKLSIAHLEKGVYFLEISIANQQVAVQKVLVQ